LVEHAQAMAVLPSGYRGSPFIDQAIALKIRVRTHLRPHPAP